MSKIYKKFKIQPDPKQNYYYQVTIFKKQKDLVKAMFKLYPEYRTDKRNLKTYGFTCIIQEYKYANNKFKLSPCIGKILLYKERLTHEVISHELYHSADFLPTVKEVWRKFMKGETTREKKAYAHSNLVVEFFIKSKLRKFKAL